MSITVEPVLLDHQWKQNGTNFFRLRITLARKTKYIKTNIMVRKEQIGRGGKVKDAGIRYELERLVRTTEETVSQIDTYALAQMTPSSDSGKRRRPGSPDLQGPDTSAP